MKRLSYQGILRQRIVVAALTLGLLTVIIGVSIELYASTQRTTLPSAIQRLIVPLDPLIDLDTIEALEEKQFVSLEEARQRVQNQVNQGVAPATEEATASAEITTGLPLVPEEEIIPPTSSSPSNDAPPAISEEPLPEN